ncbi:MAG: glycosyltransferase family 2 protein [Bacteroidaceae bacterium]|jgi:glycosyltransferase involved in cell wall biosynthesis|nr:glycosyl transferase family 2 [Bacteroidales bacterium]
MSRVTVLVAAYNAEKYLAESLDSLLGQTLHDIQIVCIDDASTDSTPDILDEYAARDSRIRVITEKVNRGQAIARNQGIDIAEGDYITMLDADDRLSADALESAVNMLDANPETGAALFRLVWFDEDGVTPYPMRSDKRVWSGQEAFELSLDWSLHGLYVARAELFKRWPYDTSCRLFSDDNTTRLHYLNAGVVRLCEGVYEYRRHGESMTNRISAERIDLLEANASMMRQLREAGQSRRVLTIFERERWINLTGICGFWLRHSEILDKDKALERFRAVWEDIDRTLLPAGLKMKFGYIPCRTFKLYFRQVEFYFTLRRLLGK